MTTHAFLWVLNIYSMLLIIGYVLVEMIGENLYKGVFLVAS